MSNMPNPCGHVAFAAVPPERSVMSSTRRPAPRSPLVGAATAFLFAAFAGSAAADCQPIQCAKPDAATGAATNVYSTGATLNGTVNTHGTGAGTWRFELGTSDANMAVVASGQADDRDGPQAESFN